MIINNNSVLLEYKNIYSKTIEDLYFPIFQRGYTWKKEQTQSLLNDIINLAYESPDNRKNKQIYLLDFIWYYENGHIKIADGQQRIITLNILIICLNEYIKNNNLSVSLLNEFSLFYDDDEMQNKYYKFYNDKKRSTAPFSNVYKAMVEFVEQYHMYIEQIKDVIENNIFVYLKYSSNVDDAFAVFTQINSGGKPLSKDDVIKIINITIIFISILFNCCFDNVIFR